MAIGHDGVVGVIPQANPICHADLHTTPALAQASAFLIWGVFTRCTPEKRCSSKLPRILPAFQQVEKIWSTEQSRQSAYGNLQRRDQGSGCRISQQEN